MNRRSKVTNTRGAVQIGNGFWSKGKYFLTRCFECGAENYASAVSTGQCAWCGSTKSGPKSKKEQV